MTRIDDLVYAARAAIIEREQREAAVLAERYARLATQMTDTTARLAAEIAAAGPAAADPAWLDQHALYAQLVRGTSYQMAQVGRFATTRLAAQHQAMVGQGARDGQTLIRTLGGEAQALDAEAVRAQVAVAQQRLTAYDLARTLPEVAAQVVRTAAAKVALLGLGVNGIAAKVKEGFGGVLTKLLFLSRSEMVTPYRDTTLAVFARNGVASWQWHAEIERQHAPCGMCIAMHGRVHPIAEPFATHHGCRCLPVPVLPSAPPPVSVGGAAWFAQQDATVQLQVLGRSKMAHYQSGAMALDALVSDDVLPDGRRARREMSLMELGLERVRTPRPPA